MNNKHLKNKSGNDKCKKLKLEDNAFMNRNKGKRAKSAKSSMLFILNALKVKIIAAIMMIALMLEDLLRGQEMKNQVITKHQVKKV